MTDLEDRFRTLDRLDAPDLWPEAERRRPGTARAPSAVSVRRRGGGVGVAAVGIGLVVRAFSGGTPQRSPQPATTLPHGVIAFDHRAGPRWTPRGRSTSWSRMALA